MHICVDSARSRQKQADQFTNSKYEGKQENRSTFALKLASYYDRASLYVAVYT